MRRTKRDYYELLGVPRAADYEQISRAFRRLERDLHPDVSESPETEERFRAVSTAYNVLSKPRSRFLYDHFGFRGRGTAVDNGSPVAGPNVLGEVELEQVEAARGARREVRIGESVACTTCDGSGAAPGAEVRICAMCLGHGTLEMEPCPECGGDGRFQARCQPCGGLGELTAERTIMVRIPPGVEDGTTLPVAGKAENASLIVRVKPAPAGSLLAQVAAVALFASAVALLVYFLLWV